MTNFDSVFTRLARNLRELGASGTVLHLIDQTLLSISRGHWRLRVYALVAQPIGNATHAPVRAHSGTVIAEVASTHPVVADFPRSAAVNSQRWAAGAQCLAATVDGQFAGTIWIARERHIEDEVRCRYELCEPIRSVWDFDMFLAPRYRGGRMFARLWQAVDARLCSEGVEWTFSRISLLNPGSMAAHKRMNAQRVGLAAFLSLGSMQISLFSLAPFIHVGVNRNSQPTVRLQAPRHAVAAPRGKSQFDETTGPQRPAAPSRRPAALVLGLDSHGLAVARALADAGVCVYALEPDPAIPGAASNRVKKCFALHDFSEEHLLPALLAVRAELREHPRVVLMAINDRQVTAISKHLGELRSLYAIAWADAAQTILKLQRKDELEAYSRGQGLLYPRSALFLDAHLPLPDHGLRYPIILKPVQPLSSFKTLLAHDADELERHLRSHPGAMPILAQEYIPGGDSSIYFGALILDRGRVVHALAGQKIASHPPARGQTTIAQTVDAPEVLRLTEQFFEGAGLTGPVSLELKRDPEGHYWVIEPTVGRTDFWAELCIAAGFNQPLMEWQLASGLPIAPAEPTKHSLWYDTERDPLAWLRLCWQERSLRPRGARQWFPYHGHGDWRPVVRAFRRVGRARLRNWFRRPHGAAPAHDRAPPSGDSP